MSVDADAVVQRIQARFGLIQRGTLAIYAIAGVTGSYRIRLGVSQRAGEQCQNPKSCFNLHIGAPTVAVAPQGFRFYTIIGWYKCSRNRELENT